MWYKIAIGITVCIAAYCLYNTYYLMKDSNKIFQDINTLFKYPTTNKTVYINNKVINKSKSTSNDYERLVGSGWWKNKPVFSTGEAIISNKVEKIIFKDEYKLVGCILNKYNNKAIIENTTLKKQYIVKESNTFDEVYTLKKVKNKSVIISYKNYEKELFLIYENNSLNNDNITTNILIDTTNNPTTTNDMLKLIGTNLFGEVYENNKYIIQRSAIDEYIQELLKDPERIETLYAAMEPKYDVNTNVEGYVINSNGESKLFENVGLKKGDTLKSINNLRLTSQERCEYLINKFIKNNLTTISLDVERNGSPVKISYEIKK